MDSKPGMHRSTIPWVCWTVGGLGRLLYIMVVHPASAHTYSDMAGYIDWASRILGPQAATIADTVHAPGTPIYYALLHAADPSWNLCGIVQWLVSLGSMAWVWHLGSQLYGPAEGLVALGMVSLYLPWAHYAGLFLAENPFIFCLLSAFGLLVQAIHARRGWYAFAWAVAGGAAASLAASFKNAVTGACLVTGAGYTLYAIKNRRPHLLALATGTVLGLAVFFVPMSLRCTQLSAGHFCLAANNVPMNMLIGHYGKKGMFHWADSVAHTHFYFESPTSVLRGYTEPVFFDFGAYDNDRNSATLKQWVAANAGLAAELSITHVMDLFFMRTLWPAAVHLGVDWGAVYQKIFWLVILLPATVLFLLKAASMARCRPETLPEILLFLPLFGVMATVFFSVSEVRYRVPFDGFLMVLAARAYVLLRRKMSTQSS